MVLRCVCASQGKTMGLDDQCYELTNAVADMLSNGIVYTLDQTMNAETLEWNETHPPKYNGYSLAFHMLFTCRTM